MSKKKPDFIDWLYEQRDDTPAGRLSRFVFTRMATGSFELDSRTLRSLQRTLFSYRIDMRDDGMTREQDRTSAAIDDLMIVKEQLNARSNTATV